ncbi:MAG: hypothetical protein M1821_006274 [Bathelium mastoideum]|nr:MAG: hypothetical protein M1821_006274 [Bathelium mastoideum]
MAAAAVDVAYISTSYSVPHSTLTTLLDEPTVELVQELLRYLDQKAREHDEVKAEKLRAEVELENAVRSGEARARALNDTVEKGLQDVDGLRKKLHQEGANRISSLESSNRDTLSLLESKSTAHDRLADELSTQHQKILALRKEVASLEEKNQATENTSTSVRFREQALQQEIDLLKKNNEWHESELKTRNSEYAKYRKEKGARISELQRANEDANSAIDSLKRTETLLRGRIDELTQKAEDAFVKIQQLEDAAAQAQDSFRVELDSSRRLAELQQQSANTARRRLQEVQQALDQTHEDAAEEIGRIQAEVDTERSEKTAAENKIAELELQLERAQNRQSLARPDLSAPSTPLQNLNGSRRMGPGSESFSPGSARTKGGLNFTQLYTDHANMKAELDVEKRRNESLSATVDSMIEDLEKKQPEIEELRMEREHMEGEVSEYAALLEEATSARDSARKMASSWEGRVNGLEKEGEILRQQLRDLSAQIKILLVGIQAREDGLGVISAGEQLRLEQIARDELNDVELEDATDSHRYISQHLTIFKNVRELQEQNTKLLRLTRDLTERMEGEEARAKRNQDEQDQKELETLRAQAANHDDEMKSLVTQSQSYIRERDMFRRMVSHKGSLNHTMEQAGPAGEFSESVNGLFSASEPPLPSIERSSNEVELAGFQKLVKEMQSQFDAYRQESSLDHKSLKQQADMLSKEKGELQNELARTTSQLTLAHERYEMLNANYNMLKTENVEAHKRLQSLAENSAKQDLRTQQVAEELIEAKSLAESIRHENSSLKAERELFKSIEGRLTEENRSLLDDRTRLNKMISDVQTLQNERELSNSDTRRRLQGRIDTLETELKTAQRRCDEEVEENRKAALRREYEQDQSRTRIDDLAKSLSNAKEELVGAKATRDQLQARVDEMKVELRSAEERVETLQLSRKPTNVPDGAEQEGPAESHVQVLTKEQELALEVSQLKRDLDLARQEIQNAKKDADQFRAISQSSEEELTSINESHDQYREEMDQMFATKEDKIKELEQRVDDLSAELSRSNEELSELRNDQEQRAGQLEEQKNILESEITRIKDENERHAETAKLSRQDLKVQANIAQQAQQSYEDELLKHAEAAKALQKLRSEYNELKTEIIQARSEAETARATLAQGESGWADVRNRYEGELADLRNRREEIQNQNKVLHEQLHNFSAQISSLHEKRAEGADADVGLQTSHTGNENLQEIITYLRREKEIVDVQYELSVQEGKRLKQQLDYAQSQLDEARQKLSEERDRHTDKEQSAANHSKLIQTINELNLFRESSTTLRAEARQAQSRLTAKTEEVQKLTEQIQPLQARIQEFEIQQEMKEGELKLLQEDRAHWRQRTQDIISKYDRIDPADLEALKTQVANLQRERDEAVSEKSALQEQVNGIPDQIAKAEEDSGKKWQETRQKLVDQFKGRSREQSTRMKQAEQDAETARKEKESLAQELTAVKAELEVQKTKQAAAISQGSDGNTGGDDVRMQDVQPSNGSEAGEVDERPVEAPDRTTLENELRQAQADLSEKTAQLVNLQTINAESQARITELETQIADLQQQIESPTNSEEQPSREDTSAHLEKLKQELELAQREVETLRSATVTDSAATTTSKDAPAVNGEKDDEKSLTERVQEQVSSIKAQLEAEYQAKIAQEEAKYKERADNLKKQLNNKLKESKEKVQQELKERDEGLEKLRVEKDEEIRRLTSEHQEELQRVKTESDAAIQEAQRLTDANRSKATNGDDGAPGTPSKAPEGWSEQETKDFISKNPTVKQLVARNVQAKLNQEKEALNKKLQAEQEGLIQEKVDAAKKSATEMESKRQAVKLGMQERKASLATLKLEVVETAAQETPARAVSEVWAIAKVAQLPKPQAQSANSAPSSSQIPSTQVATNSAPGTETAASVPSPATEASNATETTQSHPGQPNAQLQGPNQNADPTSSLPTKPQAQLPPANTGTGPGALRGIAGQGQATGIPRGGMRGGRGGQGAGPAQTTANAGPQNAGFGQAPRGGSNLPRGPGRGRGGQGRGVPPGNNQSGPGTGSPGGGRGMNPEARQFNPGMAGQKRGRDDGGEIGNAGAGSKRARGGAGGV